MVWKLPSAAVVTAPVKGALAMLPAFPWYAWAGLGVGVVVLLTGGVAAAAVAAPGTGPTPKPGGTPPVLKLGSTGDWVAYLQDRLAMTVTGTFDEATDTAVKNFQSANGLTADGIVGSASWGKLGVSGSVPSGGGGGGGSPPPSPPPDQPPVPPPAPTTGNPFGLGALPPEREGQILSFIDQGKYAHDWEPLDYTTADGHQVHVLVSRFALALHDGSDRLIVSMTFNGAQKALDKLGASMLTTRLSDEIWKAAPTKIGIPNKPWNTDSPVTGSKTSRMYEQSNDVMAKVAAKGGGQSGLVANEGKDWVITRRFWPYPAGINSSTAAAGAPGSVHNAANFGWYPGGSKSPGGASVIQSIGLVHDRGNAGGFVDYSQYVRGVKNDSLTIDGQPWDWGAALADPTVSKYIQDEGGTIPSPRHPDL